MRADRKIMQRQLTDEGNVEIMGCHLRAAGPELTPMNETVIISIAGRLRLERARAWLEDRDPGEELIIVGANLGAAALSH